MTFGLLPGADARQVAVEGVRFALNVAGPAHPPPGATPVLLLHGVPQTAVSFRHLLPELAKDRRVLAPDLKGLGESEVAGPYDLPTLVRELAALVLHEVDGPVDVVGHDWGGSIALALAGARPDLVRRLVVVNAPYRYVNLVRAAYIPFFDLPVLPELVWRVGGRRLVGAILDALWKSEQPLDPVVRAHYERVYTDPRRVQAMLSYYRDNTRPRLRSLVRGEGADPTQRRRRVRAEKHLVIWGTADPVLGMDVAESVVRDLGADTSLVAFPGVGHFPLEEVPDDAVPLVAEFLRDAPEALPVPDAGGDGATGTVPAEVLEMPVVPHNKASGRDPDARRAAAQRRTAEVRSETAKRAAARRGRTARPAGGAAGGGAENGGAANGGAANGGAADRGSGEPGDPAGDA